MENISSCAVQATESTFCVKADIASSEHTHNAIIPGVYGEFKVSPLKVSDVVIGQPVSMPKNAKTLLHKYNGTNLFVTIEKPYGLDTVCLMPDPVDVKVIENNGEKKAVIVYFADGTDEKAAVCGKDEFSLEQGISICIAKRLVGQKVGAEHGSSVYNKIIDRCVKVYNKCVKAEEKKRIEEAVKKEKYKKLLAKKQAKRIKRMEEERERQIEIQKEAYLRAMREFNTRSDD